MTGSAAGAEHRADSRLKAVSMRDPGPGNGVAERVFMTNPWRRLVFASVSLPGLTAGIGEIGGKLVGLERLDGRERG